MRKNIASTIFTIIVLIIAVIVYRKYDFNFYSKGVSELGKTVFERDSKETTNNERSYEIINKEYTDAVFYKKIEVKKYTPYKVSCMIKTKDVKQYEDSQIAGAQIILKGTEEHSKVLSGNNEWTKVEFCFNSKADTEVEVGFRLGGNNYKAEGTAWFSDLKMQEGFSSDDTTWKFECFIVDNIDVKLENGVTVKESLTEDDVYNLTNSMKRFQSTCATLCNNKMQVDYDIKEISGPITSLTYDDENGYYINEKDVYNLIENELEKSEYDFIYICAKLPSEDKMTQTSKEKVDWVGLGNMEYCGKGFANIRVPSDDNGQYKYSGRNNFPEEVFLHEFLHTLERNSTEYGYQVPELHSNEKHGYQESATDGLRIWYRDYMNKDINDNGSKIGLPEEIYKYKPIQVSNFKYSVNLTYLDEPKNVVEVTKSIIEQITNLFKKSDEQKQISIVSE